MIAYLKGVVVEVEPKALVLNVNNVGYRVIAGTALREKTKVGDALELKIYHHITDADQSLFGFATAQDLEYFKLLLTVPSVGPRTAMTVLDVAAPAVLSQAIHQGDMSLLTKISGVGKRTAERIVVELKGKVAHIEGQDTVSITGKVHQEAVEALISIGFKPAQARNVIGKLPHDIATVEEAVKAALKTN